MSSETEDKIQILTLTVQIIHAYNDLPILWKLNKEYLDLLCTYMQIVSHDKLCLEKFLDAAIDMTTLSPYCVGMKTYNPLIR